MDKNIAKRKMHSQRKKRVRKKIFGTTERPRLSVFRSLKHIYAQVISDEDGRTLASASSHSLKNELKDTEGGKRETAKKVGELIAERAISKGIKKIAFDRGGYKYHGRVRSLAEGAREKGLDF